MYRETPLWKKRLPNFISVFRLLFGAYTVAIPYWYGYFFTGFVVFLFFAYTDKLDGQLARRWHVVSDFGKIIDPAADKAFVLPLFFVLGVPVLLMGQVILLCVIEGALALMGLWIYKNQKRLKEYGGASRWGKAKFVSELALIGLLFFDKFGALSFLGEFGKINLFIMMFWVTISLAAASAMAYAMKFSQK